MPARVGDNWIMARNTGPAQNAPRLPEPHKGQAAPRQDRLRPQPHPQGSAPAKRQPYPGQYDPYQLPEEYDPYAGQAAQGAPQPEYGYATEGYDQQTSYAAPLPPGGYAHPQQSSFAPQFEPYQAPQPPQHAYNAQNPPMPPESEQGWDQHPAHAGGEPYQPPGPSAHAAPHLRGATYATTPEYQADQQGWPQPLTDDVYAPQEPAWPQQGYEAAPYPPAQGYQQQGYEQPDAYNQPDYDTQAYRYGDPRYGDAGAPYPEFGSVASQAQDYSADPRFGPDDGAYAPPLAVQQDYEEQDYDPQDMAHEDDAPSGGSRLVKIAAALVLAIGIGGGLAYGYKTFIAPSSSGKPPLVRKASAPAKIKPDDPGGKKFAHTDSKILGRLSDADTKSKEEAVLDSSESDSGGPRKVSTMVIGRDGSIVSAPTTERAPPARLAETVSAVPGMTIVDGFGGRQPKVSAQPPPSAPAMVNGASSATKEAVPPPPIAAPQALETAAKPPAKPIVIARTESDPEPPKPAASAPKAAPYKAAPARSMARVARVRQPTSTSGARYVAVLASIPRSASSRVSALARFADLQQKYAAQLGGKTPDVQEANLGAKGTYHRLIVGPPGSRQEASRLCSDLKSAGYSSCWIKSY